MNIKTLEAILTKEQRELGLYLVEYPDHLSLMRRGEEYPDYLRWFVKHATMEAIQHEAHQIVQWGKSGVSFERSAVKGIDGFKVEANGDDLTDVENNATLLYEYARKITREE